ncbi:N-acetylglucosamine-1-phosphotransferase subunits alpha/beta [Phytophthora citrophthora]|uniref:N-acetylglucosamine-1-phosphotransferase subunits alpha/beta n=1 Tax=Phytophthora citrophthora TaxID=4793 RepID=A0AAD9LPI5_9STRA|nr:N-acetylglucosamine-1-phosphotransferase subunits alpha/beta [Phytophthora citrophthora]
MSSRSRRALGPDPAPPSRSGCFLPFIFFLGVLATCFGFILSEWEPVDRSNIGSVKSEDFLAYGPIDVVYTWVNGTDPRWKKEKEFWHKHWIASLTGQPLPVWGEEANVKGKDDSNSDNRFRDNEELRYSLRSLEKYAPWVRHIYVVTDGQIPSWLDIESPKLSIVKHGDIFANKSHLPVFSSPAIEWSLDNIPGLSDMFLYFNDDVFLGSPVRPEDFVSQAGVQKAYFAWEIPLCSNRCWESSLANGRCDKECNVTACDYDMGDCGCDVNPLDGAVTCDAEKIASILEHSPKPPKIGNHLCQGMCQYYWLGNGVCDRSCNVSSCGFDGGDCRIQKPYDRSRPHVHDEEEDEGMSPLVKDLWSADVDKNHSLVHMPLHVNATYLNLTNAFGVNGSILGAAHDNEELIRFASVYETEMVLLLVFGRDSDAHPMTSSVQVSVVGEDAKGRPIQLDFSIIRGKNDIDVAFSLAQERDTEEITLGVSTFQNTSIRPNHIRLPFGFRQATFRNVFPSHDAELKTEEDEETPSTLPVDNQIAVIADKLASKVPLIEVFLPFNITGKKLADGDILNLGWNMDLRLHNDEKDIDWSDHDVCQLKVPKKKPAPPAKNETKDTVATDGSSSAETQQAAEEIASVIDGVKQDIIQEEAKEEETHEEVVTEEDSGVTKCRIAEDNRGIIVTLRVLTNHAHAVLSAAGAFPDEEENEEENKEESEADESETPRASNSPTTDSTVDNSEVEKMLGEWKTSPQVADGQICFYDTDRVDPSRYRYCFAVAMGHYHSEEVGVVHKPTLWALLHPPKPKVVYTPYTGDDPALLELLDRCIDTTRRLIGIRPRVCNLNEVPVPRPSQEDEAEVDLQKQKEEEGRRLACEAQKRRLAKRKKEGRSAPNGGILSSLKRFFGNVKMAIGLGHVVRTNETLDDIEYADVCGPAPSKPEEKPQVTLRDAQAHLSKDTFGDSLRFVNKLYNRAFGKPKTSDRRRVPSHMPFLLQKSIIREIKDYWTKEIQDTSAHRFRHPQDMQFSFSYFHYLINRAKIHPHTLEEIWREYLDANRNGILDENEVLTAASLAHGDAPPEDFVNEVRECVQPEKREKVREIPTAEGTLRLSETLTPYITLEHLERCPSVRDALIKNVRYEAKTELMSEKEVTFHMLSDNFKFAWKQMMGTRARRTKFVCINDDMKFPSTAVSQILHELFLSIWPKRSQFELPFHLKNRYAHIDEYNAAQERRQAAAAIAVVILLLIAFVFRAELRALFGFQDIARARAASASQLTHDFQQAQADQEEEKTPTSPKNKEK